LPRSRNPRAELSPARAAQSSPSGGGLRKNDAADSAAAPAIVSSFPPQVGAGCRVLILGTAPSVRSLAARQSYAHPHNLFWSFMGQLYDAGPELPYETRIARLHAAHVGIWDVLKDCERTGSLDSGIRIASEVPNDIPALLDDCPTIQVIALNGAKANQVFVRRIAARIESARLAQITILALPSTSPANASIPRALKLQRWSELLRWSSCRPEAGMGD
jgi:hypoxanthine-DNA glycosylase